MIFKRIKISRATLLGFILVLFFSAFVLFYRFGTVPGDVEELAQMYNSFILLAKTDKNVPGQRSPTELAAQNPIFASLSPNIQSAYYLHAFANPLLYLLFTWTYQGVKVIRTVYFYTISPTVVGNYFLAKTGIISLSEEVNKAYFLLANSKITQIYPSPFFSTFLLSSILGLLTIIVVFYFALKAYGIKEAVIASLLLASSFPFLIEVRGAWLQHIPSLLLTPIVMLFFYLSHKKHQSRYLIICGVLVGLVGVSGYNSVILAPLILFCFFLINIDYRRNGFNLFFLILLILLGVFFGWKGALLLLVFLFIKEPEKGLKGIYLFIKNWFTQHFLPLFRTNNLMGLSRYLLLIVTAGLIYYLFTTSFSQIYGFSKSDVFQAVQKYPEGTRGLTPMGQYNYGKELNLNMSFMVRCMFVEMLVPRETYFVPTYFRAGITHPTQIIPGYPMIAPLVTVFSIIGLFLLIKKRTIADQLVIPWAIAPYLFYGMYLGFQPRYLLVGVPGLALLAARGVVLLEKKLQVIIRGWKIWVPRVIFVGFLVWTIYTTLNGYFKDYANNDSEYTAITGQHQMAQYILEYGNPNRQSVVLGTAGLVTYDNFFFNTAGIPYDVKYWDNLLSIFSHEAGKSDIATQSYKLTSWEKETLKTKDRIFYVFSIGPHFYTMPGESVDGQGDLDVFHATHFGLKPVKTIYHTSGIPSLEIYIVDKNLPNFAVSNQIIRPKSKVRMLTDSNTAGLLFNGKNLEKLDYNGLINNQITSFLTTLPNTTKLRINFNNDIDINFTPFSSFDDIRYFSQKDNISDSPDAPPSYSHCVSLKNNNKIGSFNYDFSSPLEIENITYKSKLRLYNDDQNKNKIKGFVAVKPENYQALFTLASDNKSWHYDYSLNEYSHWTVAGTRNIYYYLNPMTNFVSYRMIFEGESGRSLICAPIDITLKLKWDDRYKTKLQNNIEIANPSEENLEIIQISRDTGLNSNRLTPFSTDKIDSVK